jgi:hypothetical protein
MIKKITITLLAFSLASCFSFGEKAKKAKSSLGERNIQYYANKTVTSLEIPPDLTKPDSQEAFKLSEYVPFFPLSLSFLFSSPLSLFPSSSFFLPPFPFFPFLPFFFPLLSNIFH